MLEQNAWRVAKLESWHEPGRVGGLAIIVVWFGFDYMRIKRERKSGATQSYGHPMLDSGRLLGAAFVLISVLVLLISRSETVVTGHTLSRTLSSYVLELR